MNKIICLLNAYTLEQEIIVYENTNKVEIAKTTIENLNNKLFELVNKYNVATVSLHGARQFTKGIGQNIQKYELNKYNENKIEIIYL